MSNRNLALEVMGTLVILFLMVLCWCGSYACVWASLIYGWGLVPQNWFYIIGFSILHIFLLTFMQILAKALKN